MREGELENVKDQIASILESDPATRNSDRLVYIVLCERFYGLPRSTPLSAWVRAECPDYESSRRTRAYIQNVEKRFLPTDPEIAKKRHLLEEHVKGQLGYSPPADDGTLPMFGDTRPNEETH